MRYSSEFRSSETPEEVSPDAGTTAVARFLNRLASSTHFLSYLVAARLFMYLAEQIAAQHPSPFIQNLEGSPTIRAVLYAATILFGMVAILRYVNTGHEYQIACTYALVLLGFSISNVSVAFLRHIDHAMGIETIDHWMYGNTGPLDCWTPDDFFFAWAEKIYWICVLSVVAAMGLWLARQVAISAAITRSVYRIHPRRFLLNTLAAVLCLGQVAGEVYTFEIAGKRERGVAADRKNWRNDAIVSLLFEIPTFFEIRWLELRMLVCRVRELIQRR